jgi:GNAT superfamily N-acetyltransferase
VKTSRPSFGTRESAAICRCPRYKLQPKEAFKSFPAEERAARLRAQTNRGDPVAGSTSGLVAYHDGEPVGWCAVEPRPTYFGLLSVYRVPCEGRSEDKTDDSVWAVTCVLVRAGYRGRGIAHTLVRATVEFERRRGGGHRRATRCSHVRTRASSGTRSTWAHGACSPTPGFREVSRPGIRRVVMRIDFDPR